MTRSTALTLEKIARRCEDDGEPGQPLGARTSKQEGDPEPDGGQGVSDVVDQVGEQSDRAREEEDGRLDDSRQA